MRLLCCIREQPMCVWGHTPVALQWNLSCYSNKTKQGMSPTVGQLLSMHEILTWPLYIQKDTVSSFWSHNSAVVSHIQL